MCGSGCFRTWRREVFFVGCFFFSLLCTVINWNEFDDVGSTTGEGHIYTGLPQYGCAYTGSVTNIKKFGLWSLYMAKMPLPPFQANCRVLQGFCSELLSPFDKKPLSQSKPCSKLRPHHLNEGPLIEGGAKMVPLQMPTNCTSPVSVSTGEKKYNVASYGNITNVSDHSN